MTHTHPHTPTYTHTQPFNSSLDFVRDNPGELVPDSTFCHLLDKPKRSEATFRLECPIFIALCAPSHWMSSVWGFVRILLLFSSLVFCSYEQVLDIVPGRRKRRSDGAGILSSVLGNIAEVVSRCLPRGFYERIRICELPTAAAAMQSVGHLHKVHCSGLWATAANV